MTKISAFENFNIDSLRRVFFSRLYKYLQDIEFFHFVFRRCEFVENLKYNNYTKKD